MKPPLAMGEDEHTQMLTVSGFWTLFHMSGGWILSYKCVVKDCSLLFLHLKMIIYNSASSPGHITCCNLPNSIATCLQNSRTSIHLGLRQKAIFLELNSLI